MSDKSSTSKPIIQQLVMLLANGEWHSGQQLANDVGLSRTAVWKQLNKLNELGLNVETQKGKGYRLTGALSLLNAETIYQQLSATAQQYFLLPKIFFTTDSTNTQASNNLQPGFTCFAEYQSAGKGRRGRQWMTPFASQISMSVVSEFSSGIADLSGLSLAVGLCVVEVLEQFGLQDVGLKWPNDILYQGKKLGGILLEIRGDISGPCQIVLGVGLNVSMSDEKYLLAETQKIDQAWIDLKQIAEQQKTHQKKDSNERDRILSRNDMAAALLNRLADLMKDYAQLGFSFYQQAWIDRDVFYNQTVQVSSEAHGEVIGVEKGVDAQGQLLLETESGIEIYNGGEVSLRLVSDEREKK